MNRRAMLKVLSGSLLAPPLIAQAQPRPRAPEHVHVVGLLAEDVRPLRVWQEARPGPATPTFGLFTPSELTELEVTLRQAFSALRMETRSAAPGATQAQNLSGAFAMRSAAQARRPLESLAEDLLESGAEVIVTIGTPATLAVLKKTRTLPIVAVGVSDPVALGLAQSLAKPGGNVTGLSLAGPELLAKGLELIVQAVPGAQLVAILWNPSNPGAAVAIGESYRTARSLRVRLFPAIVERQDALDAVLENLKPVSPQALLVLNDAYFMAQWPRILKFAQESRLPTMFQTRAWVEYGGLMAYGPSLADMQRRAAAYVVRLLQGAKPADLPIEEPRQFELIVNTKSAKALGLTIPPSLLQRADQVIE